jgi:hypothetical protein
MLKTSRLNVLLAIHQYDAVLALFAGGALPRQGRPFGLDYANTLMMAGRADDALKAATRVAAANPGDCAVTATLAALKYERGAAAARQLVAPALAAAASSDVGPVSLRCGILSFAAIADAQGAAAQLRRVAGSERLLRAWALDIMGTGGAALLKTGRFPVSRVIAQADVVSARRDLDRAYAVEAERISTAISDITPQ